MAFDSWRCGNILKGSISVIEQEMIRTKEGSEKEVLVAIIIDVREAGDVDMP